LKRIYCQTQKNACVEKPKLDDANQRLLLYVVLIALRTLIRISYQTL